MIKQYFDIDIYPTSIRRILIKLGYRSMIKPKNATYSWNKDENIAMNTSFNEPIEDWQNVFWTDKSKIELAYENGRNAIKEKGLKILWWWFNQK